VQYRVYVNLIATGKLKPQHQKAFLPFPHSVSVFAVCAMADVDLNPEKWDWNLKNGEYVPVPTDMQPAQT